MPVQWKECLEYGFYVLLLFFIVPIEYKGELSSVETNFKEYLNKFNKSYENATIYHQRLKAFKNSLEQIRILNNGSNTAHYGLTKFSDMLPEEFVQKHLSPRKIHRIESQESSESSEEVLSRSKRSSNNKLPQRIDWRNAKVITKVKNQKQCGACWAFSTIETVEAMYAIKFNKTIEFSVQQMIDCSKKNYGCLGGDICSLLDWLKTDNVDIVAEKHYPMNWGMNSCQKVNSSEATVKISEYYCNSLTGMENIILEILANVGPVAVAINAQTWQNYIGGVVQYHCDSSTDQLNHAVQLVGYDLSAKVPFYIARNTWGEDFGENGYLRLAIGKNICGLAHEVAALHIVT